MSELSYLFSLFISLVQTSFPFLLLGIFVSSLALVTISEGFLGEKLPRNRLLGSILGSSLGLLIPVGQYGNIPVTRRLLLKGVSLPIALSFWTTAPTLNPWVIILTSSLFPDRPYLLFLRIILGWICGILIGLLFSFYPRGIASKFPLKFQGSILLSGSFLRPLEADQPLHRSGNLSYEYAPTPLTSLSISERIRLFWDNSWREGRELGAILIYGCAIAAILQFYWPPATFVRWGQSPELQIFSLLGLSLGVSAGSWAGTTLIYPFSSQLLSGSILAFFLLSAFVDIKSICLMIATFRPKIVFILLLLLTQFIIWVTLAINLFNL